MKKKAMRILERLLKSAKVAAKWDGARFRNIKMVGATNVGQVGEQFAVEMLCAAGYKAEPQKRGEWDIRANGRTMEVKCASEDTNGGFQFNGVRYDTKYDFLLVVGISPESVHFRFYKRRELMELPLARMAKNTSGTYKLSRRPANLLPIQNFADEAAKFLGAPGPRKP